MQTTNKPHSTNNEQRTTNNKYNKRQTTKTNDTRRIMYYMFVFIYRYSTTLYGELSLMALRGHDTATPFFLYFPIQAVHTPYMAPPDSPHYSASLQQRLKQGGCVPPPMAFALRPSKEFGRWHLRCWAFLEFGFFAHCIPMFVTISCSLLTDLRALKMRVVNVGCDVGPKVLGQECA
jgi:hypothetical protein